MTTDSSNTLPAPTITQAAAAALIDAACAAAIDLGLTLAVAVTDTGGHLKAFQGMDEAPFLACEVAVDKAWTSVSYRLPTHVWSSVIQSPVTAQLAHRPRLVAVGGGYPILSGGQVVGGLGVSGATADQDQQVAETALRALGFDILA